MALKTDVQFLLQKSIDYIETNLTQPIILEDVASHAYMSVSSYYTMFKALTQVSLKAYIRKRRLTLAASELIQTKSSVLEIALKYQYESYEAFSRVFKHFYGMSPTQYRKEGLYVETFPRMKVIRIIESEGQKMANFEMNKDNIKNIIESTKKGYLMDVDIDHFITVNEKFGREGGDKVLVELPRRIKGYLKDRGIHSDVLRYGADEFIIVFEDSEEKEIKDIATDIIDLFKSPIEFEAQVIPVTVSIGLVPIHVGGNAEIYIEQVNASMLEAKKMGRNTQASLTS